MYSYSISLCKLLPQTPKLLVNTFYSFQSPWLYSNLRVVIFSFLKDRGREVLSKLVLSSVFSTVPHFAVPFQQFLCSCNFTLSFASYCRSLFMHISLSGSLPSSWLRDDEGLQTFQAFLLCLSTFSLHTFLSSIWFQPPSTRYCFPPGLLFWGPHHRPERLLDFPLGCLKGSSKATPWK